MSHLLAHFPSVLIARSPSCCLGGIAAGTKAESIGKFSGIRSDFSGFSGVGACIHPPLLMMNAVCARSRYLRPGSIKNLVLCAFKGTPKHLPTIFCCRPRDLSRLFNWIMCVSLSHSSTRQLEWDGMGLAARGGAAIESNFGGRYMRELLVKPDTCGGQKTCAASPLTYCSCSLT